jgi:hypothetical protein
VPNTNATGKSHIAVRLVGNIGHHSGRVQIGLAGIWGSVCADQWDASDAAVVCHELGYGRNAAALRGHEPALGRDIGLPAWIDRVNCAGYENALKVCT